MKASAALLLAAGTALALWFAFTRTLGAYQPNDFEGWCQAQMPSVGGAVREAHILGLVHPSGVNSWNTIYPHQDPIVAGNSQYEFRVDGAQRLTLEYLLDSQYGTAFGYGGPSNVQTFMVWRQN